LLGTLRRETRRSTILPLQLRTSGTRIFRVRVYLGAVLPILIQRTPRLNVYEI
jgi:hypothetical protein